MTQANRPFSKFKPQQGAALFIALVALASMTLAGIALVRSVDTSNLIAGNFAFRQAALQASDIGSEQAIDHIKYMLHNNKSMLGSQNYWNEVQKVDNKLMYSPVVLADSDGDQVPDILAEAPVLSGYEDGPFVIRYVIERLCNAAEPHITTCATPFRESVYYRISVRVDGPRNSQSTTQAVYRSPPPPGCNPRPTKGPCSG